MTLDNERIPNAIHGLGYPVIEAEQLLLWLYDNLDATVPQLLEELEKGFDDKFLTNVTFRIPKRTPDNSP